MESQEGRRLHALAEQARESGDSVKALNLTDQAMLAYQKDGDNLGFAEVLSSRFLSLRHLFDSTEDKNFLILAKHQAEASVEIAEKAGDKTALAIPLFNLAKAQETLEQIPQACEAYKKAADNMTQNPPQNHNRAGILADFKIHLATCEYRNGDKEAMDRALQALSELKDSDETKYNKDVWLSGAHMRIADALREDDADKALKHLQKAKEIIDSNPDLKLRLNQWEKLNKKF